MPGKAHPWIQPDPTGFTDGPNLYQYCRNNPLCYRDRLGLSTSHYYTTHDSFEEYFFYHRRDEDKSGGTLFLGVGDYYGGLLKASFEMNLLARVHGSMQALGGLVEAGVGGGATFYSGGSVAFIGIPVMVHSLDQFIAGMNTVITGEYRDTVTSQLLQATGISSDVAGFVDSGFSMVGTFGGTAILRAGQLSSFLSYRLPVMSLTKNEGWVLPENGGGALINCRWYTEHALERMAPRTPQVMAKLEDRMLERSRAVAAKLSPKEFRKWQLENLPDPCGVPPCVIEAEISNPGSTGIRVIINDKGDVITVIPKG